MASHAALSVRRANAMNRLSAAVSTVSASFNIAAPEPLHPAALRDPQIAEIARLEQIADLLEQIEANKSQSEESEEDNSGNDDIPDDFPGAKHLHAAGITTIDAVRPLSREELIAIKGIGEATADDIIAALS